MLESIETAKNVAKRVQLALAEAIDAFKWATKARKQRLAAKKLLNSLKEKKASLAVGANTPNINKSVLPGIRVISSKLVEHG